MPAHLPELSSTPSPLPSWPSRCAGLLLFPHCLSPFPSHLPPLFALRAPRHHSALKSKVMSAERPPGSRASPSPLHRPPSIPRDAAQANIYSVIVSPLCLDWKFHESRDKVWHRLGAQKTPPPASAYWVPIREAHGGIHFRVNIPEP